VHPKDVYQSGYAPEHNRTTVVFPYRWSTESTLEHSPRAR
jgi:hypothetical protein